MNSVISRFNKKKAGGAVPTTKPPTVIPVFCENGINKGGDYTYDMFVPLLNTFIYVWLKNGDSFWMYPVKTTMDLLCGYTHAEDKWQPICFGFPLIKSFY